MWVYQSALDQIALQGYANAQFEVDGGRGLDLVEEFYMDDDIKTEQTQLESKAKAKPKFNQSEGFVQNIQQGLQGSVRAVKDEKSII